MRKIYFLLFWLFAVIGISNAQTVTIGTSTATPTTANRSPWNPYYGYSYVQTIYLQSEINASGNITSISYYYGGPSLGSSDQIKVYMAKVARTSFASTTDFEPLVNLTLVFDGTISATTLPGIVTITLATPFAYNNTDNLLIAIDENKAGFEDDLEITNFRATTIGTNRVLSKYSDTVDPDPAAPGTASNRNSLVGNIQINGLSLVGCQAPTGVTVSSVTQTSATASWTAPAGGSAVTQYNWELRSSGVAGSGATGLINSGNTAATSVNLTGLTSNTNDTFYVRSDCGSGSTSPWSPLTAFYVPCSAFNLPYTLDFNAVTAPALPSCLTKQDINADGFSWSTFTPATPTPVLPSTLVRYSYNSVSSAIGANDWLYTGGLNLSTGVTYQLKFKYKASNGPTYVEKLEVKYGTSATVAGMTSSAIFSNTNIASALADPYADANVTFTVPANGVYYLGLHAFSDPDQAFLYVDDISVQVLVTCDQPSDITPSAITPTSATVSWTAPTIGTVTNYTWELRTSGAAGSGATGLITSGNTTAPTVNLNSLPPGATYTFYVKTNCITPDASTYNSAVFATPSVPPANDDCTAAIELLANTPPTSGTGVGASASPSIPTSSCAGTPDDDVWYKFTALYNGSATITVIGGTGYDAVIQGFSGACGSLTSLGCIDGTLAAGTEVLTLPSLVAGQTYYIRVYDWYAAAYANFSIAISGSALPVSITNFKGERQGANNVLSWTTATETNNNGFELQRSADGVNFSQLAFVASKAANGNSNATLSYSLADTKSLVSGSYYRLKQIDKDGKSTLSQIVFIKGVKVSKLELVSVYPNPSVDKLNVAFVSPKADNVTFVVSDLTGKVIIRQTAPVVNGDNNININVSTLAKGTYTIKAICNDGCETAISKFVKQ